jgi:hypothetical protein
MGVIMPLSGQGRPASPVNALDRDQVAVNDVLDPVLADPEPVVPAPVKALSGVRIIGQGRDRDDDGAHPDLVVQVAVR